MDKRSDALMLSIILLAAVPLAEAQQPKVYRVGVVTAGGAWYEVIDGLRLDSSSWGLKRESSLLWQSEIQRARRRRLRRQRRILNRRKSTLYIQLKPQSPYLQRGRQMTSRLSSVPAPTRLISV